MDCRSLDPWTDADQNFTIRTPVEQIRRHASVRTVPLAHLPATQPPTKLTHAAAAAVVVVSLNRDVEWAKYK